ncbi:MAG: hypothetical protein INH13_16890 [Cupriavidus sp.]|nr:hypothetical protein [Cupriavidus sp.]MCA3704339.1 hypothetical protein [Methylobacterium sp.]
MKPFSHGALVGVLLAWIAANAVAQEGQWKTMEIRDLRERSSTDVLQTKIWSAEVRAQNDYVQNELGRSLGGRNALISASVATFAMGEQQLLVSALTSRDCDNGANHNASGREASVCPLKIALVSSGTVQVIQTDTGCLVEPAEPGAPLANQHDSVQVQFDPNRRILRMRALVGGQWVSSCSREFRVP